LAETPPASFFDRLTRWISVSILDAAGRLFLQIGTTAVLARLLVPEDFGTATLVLTLTAVAAIAVGGPFEEAIAQRRVIRRAHLENALAVSWLVALGLFALAFAAGPLLAVAFDASPLSTLLPFAMLLPIANAPWTIGLAVARRRRRFGEIALANLVGHAGGATVAVALALAEGGVWSLVAFRVATLSVSAAVLLARLGLWLRPRLSARHFNDVRWYAGMSFTARLIDDLVYLAFNYVVGTLFGLAALGYFNMALRLVEPLRGAVLAISHNLSFAHFVGSQRQRSGLGDAVVTAAGHTAFVIAPAFFGVAAVAPVLVAVMAGPGWEPAAGITVWLAVGSGLFLPVQLVITALNASGRPQYAVSSGIWGGIVMGVVILFALPAQALAAGLARCAGDLVRTVYAVDAAERRLSVSRRKLLAPLAAAWALSAAMAVAVGTAARVLDSELAPALLLVALVGVGIIFYGSSVWMVFREEVRRMGSLLKRS
jgi:O-antigen/teichoic acid export membrane protein